MCTWDTEDIKNLFWDWPYIVGLCVLSPSATQAPPRKSSIIQILDNNNVVGENCITWPSSAPLGFLVLFAIDVTASTGGQIWSTELWLCDFLVCDIVAGVARIQEPLTLRLTQIDVKEFIQSMNG